MSRVRTQGAELAVGVRRGSRTAPGRAKQGGAGPSGGGGGERGIFKHRGQGQAHWAFRAWGSGGDGIYRVYAAGRSKERTAHLSTWQRPKQDSCLTNSFIVPLTCYLYLSHLIKSLYMFMLCFANYMYIVYISGARHDAHAYS